MRIELTDLLANFEPQPVTLAISGEEYPLADLTIAQAKQLDAFDAMNDAEGVAFVASLFPVHVPPPVTALRALLDAGDGQAWGDRQRLLKQVLLVVAAVRAGYASMKDPQPLSDAAAVVAERVKAAGVTEAE